MKSVRTSLPDEYNLQFPPCSIVAALLNQSKNVSIVSGSLKFHANCLSMSRVIQDQNLVSNLRHVWPSVVRLNSNEDFWKYEWDAHGFGMKTQIDVKTYFEAASRIHSTKIATNRKTNLKDYFSNAGIQPGQIVKAQDIANALVLIIRGINIKCYNNGTHNFMKEVILCLDSPLHNFVSCDLRSVSVRGGENY
ncbi:ribonuclease 3-like [Lycium barbarum]|uniref:ribonuclease 3-like n=1 Tax=Lycium barbarum TaxID=112863 RepID=UPI00293E9970|nr:ribonuclease 3-like [Lycium barbarum]